MKTLEDMNQDRNLIENLLNELHKEIHRHSFSGVDIQLFDSQWLKIELQKENCRILWLGYDKKHKGFFITLDRDLPPSGYFKFESDLSKTAKELLDSSLILSEDAGKNSNNEKYDPDLERKKIKSKVAQEVKRLQLSIDVQLKNTLTNDSSNLAYVEQSETSEMSIPLALNGEKYTVTFKPEKQSLKLSFINFINFLLKPFKLLLFFLLKKPSESKIEQDETALQAAINILSKPEVRQAICRGLDCVDDHLKPVYEKLIELAFPKTPKDGVATASIAFSLSIAGITISETVIAMIAIILVRASIKVYCVKDQN